MAERPVELHWWCPACEREVEQSPCPECASAEVESVWSDGVRVNALDQRVGPSDAREAFLLDS